MRAGQAEENEQKAVLEHALAVKNAHQRMLLSKANVVGVGVGFAQREEQLTSEVALIVLVSRKIPSALLLPEDVIPSEIDGVPVDVQEVGTIKAE